MKTFHFGNIELSCDIIKTTVCHAKATHDKWTDLMWDSGG